MDQLIYFVPVYVRTLMAPDDTKEDFFSQLVTFITRFPQQEDLVILVDFNAGVESDLEALSNCLDHFGVGKCKENGQRLLELCSYQTLSIISTFFGVTPHYRVFWRHPRSKHWHQMDLILTRRTELKNVLVTGTYHSSTQCRLSRWPKVSTKELMKESQGLMSARQSTLNAWLNLRHCSLLPFVGHYNRSSTAQWKNVKNATHSATLNAFGKGKRTQQNDGYDSSSTRLDNIT